MIREIYDDFLDTVSSPAFQSGVDKAAKTAGRISEIAFSIIFDLILFPVAAIASAGLLASKINLNPTEPKKDKIPILLLHGSRSDESEWVIGRQFLNNDNYGSVFSLNYDKLERSDINKGIDEFAAGRVRDRILEIKKITGQDKVILVGHSMGGLIAGYYAEYLSEKDGVSVDHIITIASPWQGAKMIDRVFGENGPKRYQQMHPNSQWRKDLVQKAVDSIQEGKRKYYNVGSTTDFCVTTPESHLPHEKIHEKTFSYVGHYGIVVMPTVWMQVREWLNEIYKPAPIDASASLEEAIFV